MFIEQKIAALSAILGFMPDQNHSPVLVYYPVFAVDNSKPETKTLFFNTKEIVGRLLESIAKGMLWKPP